MVHSIAADPPDTDDFSAVYELRYKDKGGISDAKAVVSTDTYKTSMRQADMFIAKAERGNKGG